MNLKNTKELTNKFLWQKNDESILEQARLFLFMCAMLQTNFIFFGTDKPNIVNEISLIISITSAVIFIVLAFIIRKNARKIIFTGIILYSVLLLVHGYTDYTTIFQGILAKIIIYVGLIHAVIKIDSEKNNSN
jgi:hypothetical protein